MASVILLRDLTFTIEGLTIYEAQQIKLSLRSQNKQQFPRITREERAGNESIIDQIHAAQSKFPNLENQL